MRAIRSGGLWLGVRSVLVLGVFLGACGDTDDRPANWSYISATIIQPNCGTARCHSQSSAVFGLQLDTIEGGYADLVGVPGAPDPRNLVVPGNPDASKVMWMLRGIESQRMPPDEALPEGDIRLIEQWILDGARFE
jgi:hypothetical protein